MKLRLKTGEYKKLNILEMKKQIEIMENINMEKESLEWIAFKVFLAAMVTYGSILITMVIAG